MRNYPQTFVLFHKSKKVFHKYALQYICIRGKIMQKTGAGMVLIGRFQNARLRWRLCVREWCLDSYAIDGFYI